MYFSQRLFLIARKPFILHDKVFLKVIGISQITGKINMFSFRLIDIQNTRTRIGEKLF